MRAVILLHADANGPTNYRVLSAANACWSMGIIPQFLVADATAPTVTQMNARSEDILIIPFINSNSRSHYSRFMDGSINKPVFVMGVLSIGTQIKGTTSSFAEGSATFAVAKITRTDGEFFSNTRRCLLDTLTAPEVTTAIMEGSELVGGNRAIVDWKYTDGTNTVYYSTSDGKFQHLHLLVEEAVLDGTMSAPPKKAPHFMVIDHINDAGEPAAAGGEGGWQENPDMINQVGAALRAAGGVCYTNIEKSWVDGTNGTTTGALATNLLAYQDVFKCCATHDHEEIYNSQTNSIDDPLNNAQSKSFMDTSYQATVVQTEALGMTVDTGIAHFAVNANNPGWYELGSPDVSHMSDPNSTTPKAGYGFKMARSGTPNESWPTTIREPSASAKPPTHFMNARMTQRGITVISARDAGLSSDQTTDAKGLFVTGQAVLYMLNNGLMNYYHAEDFEDVAWRTANVAGNPTTTSGGVLTATFGLQAMVDAGNYCSACSHTAQFGADVNDYL